MNNLEPIYINNTRENIQVVKEEIQSLKDEGLKDEATLSDLQSQLNALIVNTASEFEEKEYPALNLSKEDSLAILKNIKNPGKANKYLKAAFKDYKQHVTSEL